MTCAIAGCVDPAHLTARRRIDLLAALGPFVLPPLPARTPNPNATPKPRYATRRRPVARTCRNCRRGSHGRWCAASLFGPWCPCRCRAVLGLDGPFEGADPTAPEAAEFEGVA